MADTETDMIDAKSQEIRPVDGEVYSKMEDLADDLPDSSPRFILLSYPLTIVSLRHKLSYSVTAGGIIIIGTTVYADLGRLAVPPSPTSCSTTCPRTAIRHRE